MEKLILKKMQTEFRDGQDVLYFLEKEGGYVSLNDKLGQKVSIEYDQTISCLNCQKNTKKSFAQGHCFRCFRSLASCDMCVLKPELCHYSQGTCREPDWGEANCFIPHTLYLANSSGLKVGITRGEQPITRWIDQGAQQGIAVAYFKDRLSVGKVEVALKDHYKDKTNWRKMLSSDCDVIDLESERQKALELIKDFAKMPRETGAVRISYPILEYPTKVKSHNFDKTPKVEGQLLGIKGQYLILDTGVLNIRKFGGYSVSFS